ncbi:glycine betaine ABC transporter substrate-binding protein [Lignipirellula cremea]|uniref:Glycine betaine/carnitine/choline transport system permease protein OpuCB n=1 Tax=Lignipirellula cremea TaxID=2528010 RepID=A0A518DPW1_9BACT|nr:glycine betaine ABC transporter substrate-binding protein [Lignipirellula cremea]QDU93876.1 Glycine betaine/carnitine/choline transport system permease protein OpuCB [Lignipirellula cremea]
MAAFLLVLATLGQTTSPPIVVGSKAFTESIILAEVAVLLGEDAGLNMFHQSEIGGTQKVWSGLINGEVDVYPEYTGTIREQIFHGESLPDLEAVRKRLAQDGVLMSPDLGFKNNYVIGVSRAAAEKHQLKKISDLARVPELRFGFSNEFFEREDGWPSLKQAYGLPQKAASLDHALAYNSLKAGDLDVVDVYTTDPKISQYDIQMLIDDRGHFPVYEAVYLYRADLADRAPEMIAKLQELAGKIDASTMTEMNRSVEQLHLSERRAAADYLGQAFGLQIEVTEPSMAARLWRRTLEHMYLVVVSLGLAICVAIPLGVLAARNRVLGQVIVGSAEIIQTIPSLALLILITAVLVPLGIRSFGPTPTIVALVMYSLLPIIRNTMTALTSIPHAIRESGVVLGLSGPARMRLIELPLASPLILAGIKTTAVINVGYAALGGLIGAGGYGATIMSGLRLDSIPLMLEGAIPAAILALVVKFFFELLEYLLVPAGLRLRNAS